MATCSLARKDSSALLTSFALEACTGDSRDFLVSKEMQSVAGTRPNRSINLCINRLDARNEAYCSRLDEPSSRAHHWQQQLRIYCFVITDSTLHIAPLHSHLDALGAVCRRGWGL